MLIRGLAVVSSYSVEQIARNEFDLELESKDFGIVVTEWTLDVGISEIVSRKAQPLIKGVQPPGGLFSETVLKKAIVAPFKRYIEPIAQFLWSSSGANDFYIPYGDGGGFTLE